MSVWVTIPSARPPEEVEVWMRSWKERGYKIALRRDEADTQIVDDLPGVCIGPYPGYAESVNHLIHDVLVFDETAEFCIAAGDDIFPDPNKSAEEIAQECKRYFNGVRYTSALDRAVEAETFGVMQPTGDRFGEEPNNRNAKLRGAYIDRVCGSAWIGREFARRVNRGNGPLWPEYFHMSVDRELQGVALKYGVLWQRPDLTHYHAHWARPKPGETMGDMRNMPAFLKNANEGMKASEALCEERESKGFPGSELI